SDSDDLIVADPKMDRNFVLVKLEPYTVMTKKDFECFLLDSNLPYQTVVVLIELWVEQMEHSVQIPEMRYIQASASVQIMLNLIVMLNEYVNVQLDSYLNLQSVNSWMYCHVEEIMLEHVHQIALIIDVLQLNVMVICVKVVKNEEMSLIEVLELKVRKLMIIEMRVLTSLCLLLLQLIMFF
ncbi:MAG: hypothetical protein EZS28_016615, partial [Streblomastix strix]